MTDLTILIRRVKQGDGKAFRVLYEHLASDLYNYTFQYVKSDTTAQEIVQDSFVRLWRSRARLDETRDPKSYLFTIAYHQILREFRQQLRNPLLRDYLEYSETLPEDEKISYDYDTYVRAIENAKKRLPPRQRQIFVMNKEQGLPPKEIASRLGISEQVVRNQLSAAMKSIRERLLGHKSESHKY